MPRKTHFINIFISWCWLCDAVCRSLGSRFAICLFSPIRLRCEPVVAAQFSPAEWLSHWISFACTFYIHISFGVLFPVQLVACCGCLFDFAYTNIHIQFSHTDNVDGFSRVTYLLSCDGGLLIWATEKFTLNANSIHTFIHSAIFWSLNWNMAVFCHSRFYFCFSFHLKKISFKKMFFVLFAFQSFFLFIFFSPVFAVRIMVVEKLSSNWMSCKCGNVLKKMNSCSMVCAVFNLPN